MCLPLLIYNIAIGCIIVQVGLYEIYGGAYHCIKVYTFLWMSGLCMQIYVTNVCYFMTMSCLQNTRGIAAFYMKIVGQKSNAWFSIMCTQI